MEKAKRTIKNTQNMGRKKYDQYIEIRVKIPITMLPYLHKPYATSVRNILIDNIDVVKEAYNSSKKDQKK